MPVMNKPRILVLETCGLPDGILGIPGLELPDFYHAAWRRKIKRSSALPGDAKLALIESIDSDGILLRRLDPEGSEIEGGPEVGRTWIRQNPDGTLYVWKTANLDVGISGIPDEPEGN